MTRIRIGYFYETTEMPNGMYARSEGPEVTSMVMVVHPDDYAKLVSLPDCEQICFDEVKRSKAAFVPDFVSHVNTDLVEYAEDGHEDVADKIFDAIYAMKARDFEDPEYVELTYSPEMSTWPRPPYKPVVRK